MQQMDTQTQNNVIDLQDRLNNAWTELQTEIRETGGSRWPKCSAVIN